MAACARRWPSCGGCSATACWWLTGRPWPLTRRRSTSMPWNSASCARRASGSGGALYRGDLMTGVSLPNGGFADWLLVERTRLHDLARPRVGPGTGKTIRRGGDRDRPSRPAGTRPRPRGDPSRADAAATRRRATGRRHCASTSCAATICSATSASSRSRRPSACSRRFRRSAGRRHRRQALRATSGGHPLATLRRSNPMPQPRNGGVGGRAPGSSPRRWRCWPRWRSGCGSPRRARTPVGSPALDPRPAIREHERRSPAAVFRRRHRRRPDDRSVAGEGPDRDRTQLGVRLPRQARRHSGSRARRSASATSSKAACGAPATRSGSTCS